MCRCRTIHSEGHYKRMAAEFAKNLDLIAGTKLGEVIYRNIVNTFSEPTEGHELVSFEELYVCMYALCCKC